MSENSSNVKPLERAREAARDHLSDARERFQEVAEKARERATEAGGSARERYDETVVQLHDGYSQVRDGVEAWSDDLQDYVRANPGKAVIFASLAGFLLGLLFRRRND